MSFDVRIQFARRQPIAKRSPRDFFRIICGYADGEGIVRNVSFRFIAEEMHVKKSTVQRALRFLREAKLVEVKKHGLANIPNEYFIPDLARELAQFVGQNRGVILNPPGSHSEHSRGVILNPQGGHSDPPRGVILNPPGSHSESSGGSFCYPAGSQSDPPVGPHNKEAAAAAAAAASSTTVGMYLSRSKGSKEETSSSSSSFPAELAAGLREVVPFIDHKAIKIIWTQARAHVPDCTPAEVLHFVGMKKSIALDPKTTNPTGFLMTAIPSCITPEAIRFLRMKPRIIDVACRRCNTPSVIQRESEPWECDHCGAPHDGLQLNQEKLAEVEKLHEQIRERRRQRDATA